MSLTPEERAKYEKELREHKERLDAASAQADVENLKARRLVSSGSMVGATLTERHVWHPPATKQAAAIKRLKTLIYRLRSRGDEYNADIAELELLPYISGPNTGDDRHGR